MTGLYLNSLAMGVVCFVESLLVMFSREKYLCTVQFETHPPREMPGTLFLFDQLPNSEGHRLH